MTEKIAIVGSRDYPKLEKVRDMVEFLASYGPNRTIVSGGAKGVDLEAEEQARFYELEVIVHKADWEHHGRAAGFLRNQQIVDDADRVIAFWDGESKGTKDTIDKTLKAKKDLEVHFP
jgi:hypothetical protein